MDLSPRASPKRILVVDDEPVIRALIAHFLKTEHFQLTFANDGEEGLRQFQSPGNFDLVISDMNMPKMSGADLAHGIKAQSPETPLATAAELEYFYSHLQRVMEAADFLDPGNPKHLMRRMRRLFNRARLDQNELNILRGLLAAYDKPRPPR